MKGSRWAALFRYQVAAITSLPGAARGSAPERRGVSPRIYSSTGMTDESAAIAYIEVRATPDGQQHLEGTELIEVLLLDYAGVCDLCENRTVHLDSKLWQTLYMFRQLGRLA